MRRRSFLAAIAAAFVAPDPEKLLWQPGKKLISIPAAQVAAPEPVCYIAQILDVTTHATPSPWRGFIVTGYDVVFSDGKVLFSFGETPPSRREARFQYRATFPPPVPAARVTAPARRQFP